MEQPTPRATNISNRDRSATRPQDEPGAPASAAGPAIRVLCVDDHAVLVEGLRAQFTIDGRLDVVGRLGTTERLLEEFTRLKPDLVLLDIEMPGPDVFETANRLRQVYPGARFVFLSAHIRDAYLTAAYKCGARGYFAKGDDPDAIVAGLIVVARSPTSTFLMGPKVRERCAPASAGPSKQRGAVLIEARPSTVLDALTAREVEVLRLIGKGLSRVEIGRELSRSAKTIDGHRERIMKKLRVSSRSELIRLAIREGFAEA